MKKLLYALLIAGTIMSCQKDDVDSSESITIDYNIQTNQETIAQWGWSVHNPKDRGSHIFTSAWREGRTIYHREYKNNGRYTIVLRVPKGNNIAIQGETLEDKLKELDKLTGYVQPEPEIDLSDPYIYVDMFIEEALNYGYDFTKEKGSVTIYAPLRVSGYSINSCGPGYRLYVQEAYWNRAEYLQRKHLIFHELGHALLELNHVCNVDKKENISGFDINWTRPDIMFSGGSCSGTNINGWAWQNEDLLDDMIHKMFSLTDQKVKGCFGSKGEINHECTFE